MDEQGKATQIAAELDIYVISSNNLDKEWLDAINNERRVEQLNKVTYETFEIIMDRLEKEWFDLVCHVFSFL